MDLDARIEAALQMSKRVLGFIDPASVGAAAMALANPGWNAEAVEAAFRAGFGAAKRVSSPPNGTAIAFFTMDALRSAPLDVGGDASRAEPGPVSLLSHTDVVALVHRTIEERAETRRHIDEEAAAVHVHDVSLTRDDVEKIVTDLVGRLAPPPPRPPTTTPGTIDLHYIAYTPDGLTPCSVYGVPIGEAIASSLNEFPTQEAAFAAATQRAAAEGFAVARVQTTTWRQMLEAVGAGITTLERVERREPLPVSSVERNAELDAAIARGSAEALAVQQGRDVPAPPTSSRRSELVPNETKQSAIARALAEQEEATRTGKTLCGATHAELGAFFTCARTVHPDQEHIDGTHGPWTGPVWLPPMDERPADFTEAAARPQDPNARDAARPTPPPVREKNDHATAKALQESPVRAELEAGSGPTPPAVEPIVKVTTTLAPPSRGRSAPPTVKKR